MHNDDAMSFAWASSGRFLLRAVQEHEPYIIGARPVGAQGICLGRTGRPTAHRAFGSDGYPIGRKPRRNAAASLSRMEGAQGGLPFSEPTQSWLGGDPKSALGPHLRGLLPTRRISADRGYQRTGLQLSPGDRRVGPHRQWSRTGLVAAQHLGGAGLRLGLRAAAVGGGGGSVGAEMLAAPGATQARAGDVAAAGKAGA